MQLSPRLWKNAVGKRDWGDVPQDAIGRIPGVTPVYVTEGDLLPVVSRGPQCDLCRRSMQILASGRQALWRHCRHLDGGGDAGYRRVFCRHTTVRKTMHFGHNTMPPRDTIEMRCDQSSPPRNRLCSRGWRACRDWKHRLPRMTSQNLSRSRTVALRRLVNDLRIRMTIVER